MKTTLLAILFLLAGPGFAQAQNRPNPEKLAARERKLSEAAMANPRLLCSGQFLAGEVAKARATTKPREGSTADELRADNDLLRGRLQHLTEILQMRATACGERNP